MKILQVIPFFGPAHGGSARLAFDTSKYLLEKGHEVTFFTSDYLFSKEWVLALPGVRVYPFKTLFKIANFFITPSLVKQVKSSIASFDIVFLHNFRSYQNIVVSKYASKLDVPYIMQAHGSMPVMMGSQIFKKVFDYFFASRLLNGSFKVIAHNSSEALQYENFGVPTNRIEIVLSGIDRSQFSDLPSQGVFRAKFGIREHEKLVLFLGRIHKIKGLDNLARAFSLIISNFSNVRLVVVGPDDGYLAEFRHIVRMLGIQENVSIIGPLYDKEKLEAYVDADVYVLPSRYEIFGLTALESIACGTPVVVSENCGLASYIKNRVGLVSKSDSPTDLKEVLLSILSDNELRNSFKGNCKEFVKQFDIKENTSQIERILFDAKK
jgi:glycosyltransferase involved in cell wall biosynthesis